MSSDQQYGVQVPCYICVSVTLPAVGVTCLFILFIYLFESGNMAYKKHEHDRQGQKMNDKNTNIKEHTKDTHT